MVVGIPLSPLPRPSAGFGAPRRNHPEKGMPARPGRGHGRSMTRASRAVRGLWPDHNPLRRACDRAEAGIIAGLAVAFLAGGPLIALAVWQLALSTTYTTTDAEHAGWHPVRARLLAGAPPSYGYDVTVPARWQAPGGAERTGRIPVRPGTRAGATVTVWTGRTRLLGSTPTSPFQAALQAGVTAAIAVPCWGMVLLCAGILSRRVLDARRLAAWGAEWQAVDPRGPAGASPGP